MKAIILAAGQGKRLRPLTKDRPKCLVEFEGLPLIDRQILTLKRLDIMDIIIVAGWQASTVIDRGNRYYINKKFNQSNMVETLFCAAKEFNGQKDILVLYSDILYEPRVVSALMESKGEIAAVVDTDWRKLWQLRFDDPLVDAETLKLNINGTIMMRQFLVLI